MKLKKKKQINKFLDEIKQNPMLYLLFFTYASFRIYAFNKMDLVAIVNITFILLKSGRFRTAGNLLEPPKNPDLYNTAQFAERKEIK